MRKENINEYVKEIDNRINVGEIFSRKQLMEIFKISGQSGIMKTNALKLFSFDYI